MGQQFTYNACLNLYITLKEIKRVAFEFLSASKRMLIKNNEYYIFYSIGFTKHFAKDQLYLNLIKFSLISSIIK